MWLKIFFDEESFNCLVKTIPVESMCRTALDDAVRLGTTRVIGCNDVEARELLFQAQSLCPNAISRVAEAIRAAGLTP
ncbi:MAG TPA: hypothetical protein VMT22_23075 [Terriglobales bacterium]|jgi:hypothetical protein|nr:hypothetical protein [Terriglobales bacterium]